MPAPTLDGSATGTASGTGTISATLTTTQTNDIIVAVVGFELTNTLLFGTSVSGGGLTWNFRSRATSGLTNGQYYTMELWWASAPSALAAQTITATTNANFDDATLVVFGVHGCNTTNPWDANVSLPAKQFTQVGAAPTVTNVSTTNANDFLIYACGGMSSPGSNVPTGWTYINGASNAGGSLFNYTSVGYLAVTSAVSNQTYAWSSSPGNGVASIVEALTADSGGATAVSGVDLEYAMTATPGTANPATIRSVAPSANGTLLICSYATSAAASPAISSISGGGLTWARRIQSHGSPVGSLEIWSAQSSTTLASFTATITYASTPSGFGVAPFALAFRGATAAIFDANAGLPAHVSNAASASWTPSVTVSTTQAHDLMLALVGVNTSDTTAQLMASPAGFRNVFAINGQQGAGFQQVGVAYQQRGTTLSSTAVAWGVALSDTSGANAGGEYVVDALTADAASVTQAQLTQIAIQQWAQGTPQAQLTQVAVEQWGSVPAVTVQALMTQVALEQWASAAVASAQAAQVRAIIMA